MSVIVANSTGWNVINTGGASTASTVTSVPSGSLSSTNVQSALNELDTEKLNVGGSSTSDFNAKNLYVSGNILPTTTQLYDIGSPTQRFKGIYVDTAYLAVNTLYIGDTAILGTTAQTINIHADPNQHISMCTFGTGTTTIDSAKSVTVSTSGLNADVFVNATGAGSNVRLGASNEVQVTGTSAVFSCPITAPSQTITGNLTVSGNLIVNGTQSTINSTVVTVVDNTIVLNYGEVGNGVTAGIAGFQIDRGGFADYQLVFDEADDMFKVGQLGTTLETIATRNWVDGNYSLTIHNHTIDSLNNVTISNKQTNDYLKWNGTSWVNASAPSNVTGDFSATGTISSASVKVADSTITSTNFTTVNTTPNQPIPLFDSTVYRSARVLIQITSGTSFQITEIILIHDGMIVNMTEYGTVTTSGVLGMFDVDLSANVIRLLFSPVNATNTVKVVTTSINM